MLSALRRRARAALKKATYGAIPDERLVERGPPGRRRVAITFDDGPDEMTLAFLDVLDDLAVPATFFLLGKACEAHPELLAEYVRRGHQVASHGYDHTHFPRLKPRALAEQLRRTDEIVAPHTSTVLPWVRPPYGNVDARVLAQLLASGRRVAMWSLDSLDYETKDASDVARRCAAANVSAGEVILLHEGQRWTLEALPIIVRDLRHAGYELVTMSALVGP